MLCVLKKGLKPWLIDSNDWMQKSHRWKLTMTVNLDLRSPQRLLIALQIDHSELNALIDQLSVHPAIDDLQIRRLKKQKLILRDRIAQLQHVLLPKEPA